MIIAAKKEREDIILLLLDRGADINAVGGIYGTPLAAAAFCGSTNTVLLLLDRGANINAVGGKYGTALAAAASRGGEGMVLLLLERGADINIVGGKYGTALVAAVVDAVLTTALFISRRKSMISLLLDHGADIDAVGRKYGTALAAAAYRGRIETVLVLLDKGADINIVGGDYGTALATATYRGWEDIVMLLLDRGADINAVGGIYGTALAAAAFRGRVQLVSMLLDKGANIKLVGGEYGTALAAAVFCKSSYYEGPQASLAVVSLLLGRGADIDAVGRKYGTALAAAAYCGSKDIAWCLLDRGADINAVGGEYVTALGAAVFAGRKDMVSVLLGQGADMTLVTSEFGTVLGQAIYQKRTEIALLLLDHGADIMSVGGSYPTATGMYPSALDVARSEGCRTTPELLVRLQTAIEEQGWSTNQYEDASVDPINDLRSRPPFPMPYTGPYSAQSPGHRKGALPSSLSSLDIVPTELCAGANITPEQADVPCQRLNEDVLRLSLAALVGLSETTTQAMRQWIQNDIRYFVASNFDLGLAYAAARVAWKDFNDPAADCSFTSIQRGRWHKHAQVLDEVQSSAIEINHASSGQQLITSPYSVMPRRLWDLKSNRVVDFRMLHATQLTAETIPTFWTVSHSWTSDMSSVWTSVNQYQWPIPLPKSVSLDYLRSELLAIGAEYIWLDVVCLRQQSEIDSLERLRREEWKLDVPTIGNVYRAAAKIVRYFNGLGVEFSNDAWDHPRHWFQRAWTLQEIATEHSTINAGIPRDQGEVFLNSRGMMQGKVIKLRSAIRPIIQLAAQVDSSCGCEVYELAREMTKRHASQPIDKISGLFYLLRTTKLPCYDSQMTSEDFCEEFWRQCFTLLPAGRKAEILFDFPYRGLDKQWFPTWGQLLDWPARDGEYDHTRTQISPDLMQSIPGETSFFVSRIWTIPYAVFYKPNVTGEYRVKINNKLFGFYPPYLLQKPMNTQDQSVFTLATAELGHAHNWVVCEAIGKQAGTDFGLVGVAEVNILRKVGVVRTDSCGDLLVGGENGMSLVQKMDCVFI